MSRAFGHDILEGHGDFEIDNDPFFTTIQTGWTIGGGAASFDNASTFAITKSNVLVIGKTYEVQMTVTAVTGLGVRVLLGSNGPTSTKITTGTFKEIVVCSGSENFLLQCFGGTTATVDNVIVREAREYNRISVALSRGLRV